MLTNNEDFEDALRRKLQGHQEPARPENWEAIRSAIQDTTPKPFLFWWSMPIIAGLVIGLVWALLQPRIFVSQDPIASRKIQSNSSAALSPQEQMLMEKQASAENRIHAYENASANTMASDAIEKGGPVPNQQHITTGEDDIYLNKPNQSKTQSRSKAAPGASQSTGTNVDPSLVSANTNNEGATATQPNPASVRPKLERRTKALAQASVAKSVKNARKAPRRLAQSDKALANHHQILAHEEKQVLKTAADQSDINRKPNQSEVTPEYQNAEKVSDVALTPVEKAVESLGVAKKDSAQKTAETAANQEDALKKLAEQTKNPIPWQWEVFGSAKAIIMQLQLGYTATSYASQTYAENDWTRKIGYEIGLKSAYSLSSQLQLSGSVAFSMMPIHFQYDVRNYLAGNPKPVGLSGDAVLMDGRGNLQTRSLELRSYFTAMTLGATVQPSARKDLRFSTQVGYYLPIAMAGSLTENGQVIAQAPKATPLTMIGLSVGKAIKIAGREFWLEPFCQVFLKRSSTADQLANYQPWASGVALHYRIR